MEGLLLMGDFVFIDIPVTVDFYMIGREDPVISQIVAPVGIDPEEYDPDCGIESEDVAEMIGSFMDEMFDKRSVLRAHFDSADGSIWGVRLSEVQAYHVHPVPKAVLDSLIEEVTTGE